MSECKHENTASASAIQGASLWCPDCERWINPLEPVVLNVTAIAVARLDRIEKLEQALREIAGFEVAYATNKHTLQALGRDISKLKTLAKEALKDE